MSQKVKWTVKSNSRRLFAIPWSAVLVLSGLLTNSLFAEKTGHSPTVDKWMEVQVLQKSLDATIEPPEGFKFPDASRYAIELVPRTRSLHTIQSLLEIDVQEDVPDTGVPLYVLYGYKRGSALGWSGGPAQEQTIEVEVQIVLKAETELYTLESLSETAGHGATTARSLVSTAVTRPKSLGNAGQQVESILETVIGYAMGFDMDSSLPIECRLQLLEVAMSSQYWADRRHAGLSLGSIDLPRVTDLLINALEDREWPVRDAAARGLGARGDPTAIPHLAEMLKQQEGLECETAAKALGKIGDQRAIPFLLDAVSKEGDERLVRCAAESLLALGFVPSNTQERALIVVALASPLHSSRELAADLGKYLKPEVIRALDSMLADKQQRYWVRNNAAHILGEVGATNAVPTLVARLREDNNPATLVVKALGALRDPRAIPALVARLEDRDAWDHVECVTALGQIGDARVVPCVLAAMQNGSVGKAGADALDKLEWKPQTEQERLLYLIAGQRTAELIAMQSGGVDALVAWLKDSNKHFSQREFAARTLGQIGDARVLDVLEACCAAESGDSWVRLACSQAIERIRRRVK